MMPVKPMGNKFLFWVKMIKDHVCIGCATRCKNNNFSKFTQLLQKFLAITSNSHSSLKIRKNFTCIIPPLSIGKFNFTV